MGFPMAACTARAGFDTTVHDIDPTRARGFGGDEVKPVVSAREAATGADVPRSISSPGYT
jgi:3-hydroxyisobutyrate dehydrogenase-like beta-hydroxyacid dehydrogenase